MINVSQYVATNSKLKKGSVEKGISDILLVLRKMSFKFWFCSEAILNPILMGLCQSGTQVSVILCTISELANYYRS